MAFRMVCNMFHGFMKLVLQMVVIVPWVVKLVLQMVVLVLMGCETGVYQMVVLVPLGCETGVTEIFSFRLITFSF